MRPIASVLCCVCLGAAFAQTARLQQPRDEAADAVDELVLDRTLYGNLSPQQLTDEQANQMIDASIRRLDRVQQKLERAKVLVEQGILARNGLTPIREEIERRRQTADLAMSRAKLIHEIAEMARAEAELADGRGLAESHGLMIHFEGDRGLMRPKEEKILIVEFAKKFGKLLPISAEGETSVASPKYVGGKSTQGVGHYSGPCTPPGTPHHYTFVIIGTDFEPTELAPGLTLPEVWAKLPGRGKNAAGLVGMFVKPN